MLKTPGNFFVNVFSYRIFCWFTGFAYVDFRETEGLREAITRAGSARGIQIRGRRLRVDFETGAAKSGFTYRKEAYGTKLGPLSHNERKHGKKNE